MNGRSDEAIKAERKQADKAAEKVVGAEVEEIDSFFETAPHDAKPLWFLGKSLELLAGADIAVFCKGWDSARGCKIERAAAEAYGIPCIDL